MTSETPSSLVQAAIWCSATAFQKSYDHRDTGRSVSYEPGAPPYTQPDLVAVAAGLLETLGLTRAHVVGISMDGGIAQRMAVDYPDRRIGMAGKSKQHRVPNPVSLGTEAKAPMRSSKVKKHTKRSRGK